MTWGDVVTLQRGFDITKRVQNEAGTIPVVSSGGANSFHDVATSRGPGVVIGRKGTLGRVYFIDGPFWAHDTTLWVKDFKGNHPKFVYYAFQRLKTSDMNVGTASPTLNRNHVHPIPVLWPDSVTEQRGIAATLGSLGSLGSLDDKIESNRRTQTLIEHLVQARFEAAFLIDDEPDGVPISSVVQVSPRRSLARGQLATYVGMSSLPEHAAEIMDWNLKEFGSGQKFVNGDVLMARITPCLENGKTAVVDMLQDGDVGWGSTEYVVLAPRGDVSTPWIYCMARSEPVRAFAIRSMTGTSGRQRFQPGGFDKYRIFAPEQGALRAFNAEALPLFARMTVLRDESRVLGRLRDTMLPELLSGRIRVPEARETVEEAVR